MSEPPTLGVRLKSHLNAEVFAIILVVAIAAATRLYQLGTFPNFPPQWPWLGDNKLFPMLYRDEAARVADILKFPHAFPSYEPSIQIPFESASVLALGQNIFAYRLPNALASILTSAVVYLAAKELFKRKDAALVSGLFYAVMVPSIIYGRMVIYENFVALFLAFTFLCMAKFEGGGKTRWLYLGALSSALATLSQEAGLFVLLFFTFWAATRKGLKRKAASLVLSWGPVAAAGLAVVALVGSMHGVLEQWGFAVIGRQLGYQFLYLQSMPSGYIVFNQGYLKPEFWYIFAYLCVAALVMAKSRAGTLLVEVLFFFMLTAVLFFGQGTGSYYVIMLYPAMALAAGGGVAHLLKSGATGGLGLYAALYAPLVLSYTASVSLPIIAVNYSLYAREVALFLLPAAVWLALEGASRGSLKKGFPLALVVLLCFFGLLLLGTPQLYSYYFLGKAP